MRIGIFLISTGNYGVFLPPLIASIDKYFFIDDNIDIYLFTDKTHNLVNYPRINVIRIPMEHKPFPAPTLFRYANFIKVAYIINSDFLFYMDVDMLITAAVGKEILPDMEKDGGLTATLHPGFYNGGGSWCEDVNSLAFTPKERQVKYYAGGFQGGETKAYLSACAEMAQNIQLDEKNGVMAAWHDESHFNAYLSVRTPKTLDPGYCMVEQPELRKAWGISYFTPKIIALKKNHDVMRNK